MTSNGLFYLVPARVSCEKLLHNTQLLELLEDVTYALDVDIIFVDFRKAFDKVTHKRLLKKVWVYGIRD